MSNKSAPIKLHCTAQFSSSVKRMGQKFFRKAPKQLSIKSSIKSADLLGPGEFGFLGHHFRKLYFYSDFEKSYDQLIWIFYTEIIPRSYWN